MTKIDLNFKLIFDLNLMDISRYCSDDVGGLQVQMKTYFCFIGFLVTGIPFFNLSLEIVRIAVISLPFMHKECWTTVLKFSWELNCVCCTFGNHYSILTATIVILCGFCQLLYYLWILVVSVLYLWAVPAFIPMHASQVRHT